jgi:transaldolase
MNPFLALTEGGQFVWLDHISRSLITGGGLQRLIDEDGLGGITSNPTIFDKAIAGSADYDTALHRALDADPSASSRALAERLIVEDIQLAADVLRPVHDESDGANGFVSVEVSPGSAHDTAATIAEARHLWRLVSRPNVMIKVPATVEGIRAVEALTAEGINVNITLMFSLEHYEAVAQAYLRGIDRHRIRAGSCRSPRYSSAGSTWSRIGSSRRSVRRRRWLSGEGLPSRMPNASTAASVRFSTAIPSRLSNAAERACSGRCGPGTGTKNPSYSDVLYVEALIGQDTITTVPPGTMDAFRDHGRVQTTLGTNLEGAEAALENAAALGLDLHAMTEQLQADALKAFASSFDQLLANVAEKRRRNLTAAT